MMRRLSLGESIILGKDGFAFQEPDPTTDKLATLEDWMHYSDPRADREITVFGSAKPGLFYNYDDRLFGDKWNAGLKLAAENASPHTARFYELALNHFHDTDTVNIQHIVVGVNRSNGYSYRVFGYTYTPAAVLP